MPFFLETDDDRYDHSVIFGLEHLETILASEAARFIWDKISFETGCDLSFETKNVMSLLTRHWTYYTGEFVPYYEDDHKLLDSL